MDRALDIRALDIQHKEHGSLDSFWVAVITVFYLLDLLMHFFIQKYI